MPQQYDAIIIGAGVAGLWTANVLTRAGYNVIVIENAAAGGGQTLASQGMIHGGQKYAIEARDAATAIAALPARWEACFDGCGDLDLTAVQFLSDEQIMWPAGGVIAGAAVFAAAKAVNAGTQKIKSADYPDALAHLKSRKWRGGLWRLPEKVLDVKSLIAALRAPLDGRVLRGEITQLLPDGQIAVSGQALRGRVVIAAAGAGNEALLGLMKIRDTLTQRRPLRQVMVRDLDMPLHGHGVTASPKPRVTVTSHRHPDGDIVWYLGGGIGEAASAMEDPAAIAFAKTEMSEMFPAVNWGAKRWATLAIDRAEPLDPAGRLPVGPHLHQRGQVLLAWPAKLTFAPMLGDKILSWITARGIAPATHPEPPPALPQAVTGLYPWETATWHTT